MIEVHVPELEDGVDKVNISYWYVNEGEHVEQEDNLLEVTAGKRVFNVSSPATGIVVQMFFEEGEEVEVGQKVAVIEEEDIDLDLEVE